MSIRQNIFTRKISEEYKAILEKYKAFIHFRLNNMGLKKKGIQLFDNIGNKFYGTYKKA